MTTSDENKAIVTLTPAVVKVLASILVGLVVTGGSGWITMIWGQVRDIAAELPSKASKEDLAAVKEDLAVLKEKAKATEDKIDDIRTMLKEIRSEARENAREAKAKK